VAGVTPGHDLVKVVVTTSDKYVAVTVRERAQCWATRQARLLSHKLWYHPSRKGMFLSSCSDARCLYIRLGTSYAKMSVLANPS
jgi:hypothetical protein